MDISGVLFTSLGLATFGLVLGCVGLLFMGEYRDQFLKNPGALMSIEVIAQLMQTAGPGMLGVFVLLSAVLFIAGGIGSAAITVALWIVHVLSLGR